MGIEFFINDKFQLEFAADGRTRSYHDYTDFNVSNLDHDQWSMRTKLTFKPDAKNEITGYYSFPQRNFDDREGKALDRSSVPGSSLKYDYHIMVATWEYDFAKRHSLKAFAYLEKRTGNVSGFYDTTWKRLRLRYRNKISKTQKLEAIITYRDYAYDNNDTFNAIEGEEPVNSKKGFKYKLSYAHRLSSSDSMSWWVVANGAYGNFDSVNASYIYDQSVIHVGLQLDF
ncbi:MAG: hypothetical protein L3J58_06235 [Emcibacter sp.]|nr:hypothetical protein [Emcibacter sp.]